VTHSPFDLYPQAGTAGRPWWRQLPQGGWIRADGATVQGVLRAPWGWNVQVPTAGVDVLVRAPEFSGEVVDHVDRCYPMAPPPLRVGQVWAASGQEFQVLAVVRLADGDAAVVPQPGEDGPELAVLAAAALRGLVLVRGDYAPWAPPGWSGWPVEVEEEEEVEEDKGFDPETETDDGAIR